jgi:hypothetical protein
MQRIFTALHSVTSSLLQLVSQCLCTQWLPIGFWLSIWRQTLALASGFYTMIIASCMGHIAWCNIPCNAMLKSSFLTLGDRFPDKLVKLSEVQLIIELSNTNMNDCWAQQGSIHSFHGIRHRVESSTLFVSQSHQLILVFDTSERKGLNKIKSTS